MIDSLKEEATKPIYNEKRLRQTKTSNEVLGIFE